MTSTSGSTTALFTRTKFVLNTTTTTALPAGIFDLSLAKFCVYGPIFLFSVTGNLLVILTIVLQRNMKTVPMIFIANLAVCDFITTLSSIAFDLPAEEVGFWPYGPVMCRILWPLATVSTNSAALTLVAISSDRYISIIYPLNFRCRITKGRCFKIIAGIHCVSTLAVIPYIAFLQFIGGVNPTCQENWPNEYSGKAYTVLLFVLQYGLPLVVMSVIYIRIGFKLCKNTRTAIKLSSGQSRQARALSQGPELGDNAVTSLLKRKQQNEKTAKMFLLVVVIFLIFMMPHQLLWLSYDYFAHTEEFMANEEAITFVCRAFTYANSVLNAIVYGVCNGNFRRAFLLILKCQCSKARRRNLARKQRGETYTNLSRKQEESCMSSIRTDFDRKENGSCSSHNSLREKALSNNVFGNSIKRGASLLRKDRTASHHQNENMKVDEPGKNEAAAEFCGVSESLEKSAQANNSNQGIYPSFGNFKTDSSLCPIQTENLLEQLCHELDFGVYDQLEGPTNWEIAHRIHNMCEMRETYLWVNRTEIRLKSLKRFVVNRMLKRFHGCWWLINAVHAWQSNLKGWKRTANRQPQEIKGKFHVQKDLANGKIFIT